MATADSKTVAIFINPDIASVKVPIPINENGEIAIEGDTITSSKNFTFSYTTPSATLNEIAYGQLIVSSSSADPNNITTTGIFGAFISYMLGASFDILGAKRTIVQNATYGTDSLTPPSPTPD